MLNIVIIVNGYVSRLIYVYHRQYCVYIYIYIYSTFILINRYIIILYYSLIVITRYYNILFIHLKYIYHIYIYIQCWTVLRAAVIFNFKVHVRK